MRAWSEARRQRSEIRCRRAQGVALVVAVGAAMVLTMVCVRNAAGEEAIQVGDEVVLMSDDRPGRAKRGRPAVACGRDVFLVAWQDGWQAPGRVSECALRASFL